ncbi:cation:proton antiporter [Candidatus Parcubacteria bacterium]|nr:cation:proton antiporter [Candidatus Parcubacteria bacterium]
MDNALISEVLMQLVILLIAAKSMGLVFEKIKQPKVLGELIAGLLIGPSILGLIDIHNEIIIFLAELGVIVLLFEVGVETKIKELIKTGWSSLVVAIIGVVVPLMLGMLYILTFTNLDMKVAFFIGAALTATSVGLTVRVLGEMGKSQSKEGKIILGAAIIDDVLGLLLLSVMADMVATGQVIPLNIMKTVLMVVSFLGFLVVVGKLFEERIIGFVNKIKLERTYIVTAFVFALLMSYVSLQLGLATIVGAFAAGLIMERKEHMKIIHYRTHVLTQIFAPIFFVMAGAAVNLRSLFNLEMLPFIAALTVIAFLGKLLSGLGVFDKEVSKAAVGFGMLPRGEVGLIFANFGLAHSLVTQDVYSALVAVIIITTFVAPPLLKRALEGGSFGNLSFLRLPKLVRRLSH